MVPLASELFRFLKFNFSIFLDFGSGDKFSVSPLNFSKCFTRLARVLGFGVGNSFVWAVGIGPLLPVAVDVVLVAVGGGVAVLVALAVGVVHVDALVGVGFGVGGFDSCLFLRYFLLGVRFASCGIIVSLGFLVLGLAILVEGWVSVVCGEIFCFIFDLFVDVLNPIS